MSRFFSVIKKYFLVMLSVILCSLIIAGGFYYYNYENKKIKNEKYAELFTVAKLKVDQLVRWQKEKLGNAYVLLFSPFFTDAVKKWLINKNDIILKNSIIKRLLLFKINFDYENIFFVSLQKELLLTLDKDFKEIDPITEKIIDKSIFLKKVTTSDLYYCYTHKKVHFDIIVPFTNEYGKVYTVMVMRLDPHDYLYPLIQSWPNNSKSAETLIVRKEGDFVVFLNELRHRKNTTLSLKFPISIKTIPAVKAVLGYRGIIEGIDYRGVKVIADLRPVPNTEWYMVTKIDYKEIFEDLYYKEIIIFIIILMLIAMMILIFAFINNYKQKNILSINKLDLEENVRLRINELQEINNKLSNEIEVRIRTERAIENYANQVNDLYNNAPCGYHSLNLNGVYVNINDTELRWLGYERNEILNMKKFSDLITKESLENFKKNFPEFKKKGYINDLEFDMVRKDGTILPVILNATSITDKNGNFIMSRSTIFDITEIKRSKKKIENLNIDLLRQKEQLEISNKELEAFAYSISHDLRAPLRAIDGFSQFLIEDYANKIDDEGNRLVNIIRTNTKKMDHLITDLLSLSKASRIDVKYSKIDMNKLVRSVYLEITNHDLINELEYSIDDMPEALGDEVLIRQVWHNLLSNAVKFTLKSAVKKIYISGYIENDENIYYVKDTGAGFNPEYKEKLFGIFKRLHSSDEFEGTGVGLAIVFRIIQRHGGRVWANGKVNEGASFYFTLPVKKEVNND